jgi:hypothetical protein
MSDVADMVSEGGPVSPGSAPESADDEGLREFVQAASQGGVAEVTPYGILVTLFIPWSRVGGQMDNGSEGE